MHIRRQDELHDGFQDNLDPLESLDLRACKSVNDLVTAMSKTSFQARNLGEAADILHEMVLDKDCFVVLTLSGAMTPAKMGLVICDMIDTGMVDAVVSTGALMTHGFVESQGMKHFKYKPGQMNDTELYQKGYDRIYDTLELEKNLDDTELIVREVLDSVDPGITLSSSLITREMGRYLHTHVSGRGILKSAFEKNVPVYVPAFTDCELGLDVGIYNRRRVKTGKRPLPFDPYVDLDGFAKLIAQQKTIGIFTVGGGVPRNWAQQVAPYLDIIKKRLQNPCPACRGKGCAQCEGKGFIPENGDPVILYKYGVRICPEPVHWGGLCLHKDTKIEIPRNLEKYPAGIPIKDLAGKSDIPVYSFAENIVLANIRRAVKTGKKKLYKVNFAWISGWSQEGKQLNTGSIVASADHKLLMKDGGYKKVSELKQNDRLMPFNTYYKTDIHGKYRFISLNNGSKIAEHQLIGKYISGRPLSIHEVVHHQDHHTLNNEIDNLLIMDKREHARYHRSIETAETRQKRAQTLSRISDSAEMRRKSVRFWDNISKEKYESLCARRKESALQPEERIRRSMVANSYWGSLSEEERKIRLKSAHDKTRQRWRALPPEIRSALVARERNPRFIHGISEDMIKDALIQENGSIPNAAKAIGISLKTFNKRREMYGADKSWIHQNCAENHFVTSIEYFGEDETYDLTVDDTHNFVANGIVVSNSGCTYSEGISWGKFIPPEMGGRYAEVLVDATVAWPLVVKAVMERMGIP